MYATLATDTAARPRPPRADTRLSVIVPTRNERGNVIQLVGRLETALSREAALEILFVDDSTDETPALVAELAATNDSVRLLHRPAGQRVGGLGGAVVAGFAAARGDVLVVMDGDLQHPPELVPEIAGVIRSGRADIAIASRFLPGGSAVGLSGIGRHLASHLTRTAARLALAPARSVCDPLSGFFGVHRDVVRSGPRSSDGFKVLLDVLAEGTWEQIAEIPVVLGPRPTGDSKASTAVASSFLRQLRRLRRDAVQRSDRRHAGAAGVIGGYAP